MFKAIVLGLLTALALLPAPAQGVVTGADGFAGVSLRIDICGHTLTISGTLRLGGGHGISLSATDHATPGLPPRVLFELPSPPICRALGLLFALEDV